MHAQTLLHDDKKLKKCLPSKHLIRILGSVDAGWSSLVARRAHNPKVVGSNPAPATTIKKAPFMGFFIMYRKETRLWQSVPSTIKYQCN